MRNINGVVLLILVIMLVFRSSASAIGAPQSGTSAAWCTDMGIMVESGVTDADVADTLDGLEDPAKLAKQRADNLKQFRDDYVAYRTCAPGADRDLASGYFALWQAILEHHAGHEWSDDLNASTQIFQRCLSRFYGTNRGGKCQTMVDSNVKRKLKWERE